MPFALIAVLPLALIGLKLPVKVVTFPTRVRERERERQSEAEQHKSFETCSVDKVGERSDAAKSSEAPCIIYFRQLLLLGAEYLEVSSVSRKMKHC